MSEGADELHVGARVRGRVLVRAGEGLEANAGVCRAEVLVLGFHGYAENAETMLGHLENLDVRHRAVLCSVQALHPFYARGGAVGASWMTKQDRGLAIEDNLGYVSGVLDRLREGYAWERLVVVGFSQGVAMAWRVLADAAGREDVKVDGLIALAGGVPPDVKEGGRLEGRGCGPVLLGRGLDDRLYPKEKMDDDFAFCESAGLDTKVVGFEGGHGWAAGFTEAVDVFLSEIV